MTVCVPKIPIDGAVIVTPVLKLPAPKPLVVHITPDCKQQPPVNVDRRDDACELRLTSALLEIARLRSLYLDAAQRLQSEDECPPPTQGCPPPCDAAQVRRAYAPPPLGEPTEQREVLPPDQPPPLKSMRIVTNLGSLIDVLL